MKINVAAQEEPSLKSLFLNKKVIFGKFITISGSRYIFKALENISFSKEECLSEGRGKKNLGHRFFHGHVMSMICCGVSTGKSLGSQNKSEPSTSS